MNIAFITNHKKTELFVGIAARLRAAGRCVHWLSTGRRWTAELLNRGVNSSEILDITTWGPEWSQHGEIGEEMRWDLQQFENTSGLRVNDIVLMDRLLNRKP